MVVYHKWVSIGGADIKQVKGHPSKSQEQQQQDSGDTVLWIHESPPSDARPADLWKTQTASPPADLLALHVVDGYSLSRRFVTAIFVLPTPLPFHASYEEARYRK
jgi:hypothetical protein